MKRIMLALVLVALMFGSAYAQYRTVSANASPAIVAVSGSNPTQEVTFPIAVRHVMVFNYDANDSVWINYRGSDTDGANVNSQRFLLGPSSVISLNDYITGAITIVCDTDFGACDASPVSVIGLY